MLLEFYPKSDGMQLLHFMFRSDRVDPEDLWIRTCLSGIVPGPKRVFSESREGVSYETQQYGQCVIGQALYDIQKHQEIVKKLRLDYHLQALAEQICAEQYNSIISQVAYELAKFARFTVNDQDDLSLVLTGVDQSMIDNRVALLQKQYYGIE